MSPFAQLFRLYPTKPDDPEELRAQEKLAPYITRFNISFCNGNIQIGNSTGLLNSLPLKNIHAIVDDTDCVYIVLHASIYTLCKDNGEVKIYFKKD